MPNSLIPPAFDVLIIGSGAAGLYAALCLPSHLRVGLITKEVISLSASDWAQGGIAAAIAPDDSPSLHLTDTLSAGAGLCDRSAVEFLVHHAPQCIHNLVDLGVGFDRKGADLALTLEAAHSRRRVLHAADTTGRAVVTALIEQVLQRPNIQVISPVFVVDLWMAADGKSCQGVSAIEGNQLRWIQAGATVLATGGGGQVFAHTTNPAPSTGDGVAIAWRAGAELRDLEFIQFHPTALFIPGAPRFLISEAVRGEGAHLVDAEGQRFVFDYHPAGELAPRDVVSRAIFSHLQRTSDDPAIAHVWLDLRPIAPEVIRHRFPNIIQVCQQWGIDVFQTPIPVAPAAHYWMGGITTDLQSATSIPNLYALGETASTGVHGANRLASNSLLECLVFGAQLAHLDLTPPQSLARLDHPPLVLAMDGASLESQTLTMQSLRQNLQRVVWQSAGICRSQPGLEEAIAHIKQWQIEFSALPLTEKLTTVEPEHRLQLSGLSQGDLKAWGETRNLLDIAALILRSAAFRLESRGGHYRLDYPEPQPDWAVHTTIANNLWQTTPLR